MALSVLALNEAANAITVDLVKLHSGDPGAAGNANFVASSAISLSTASLGVRSMASPLEVSVPASTVSHYSLWSGSSLKSTKAFAQAETYAAPGIARITSVTLSAT